MTTLQRGDHVCLGEFADRVDDVADPGFVDRSENVCPVLSAWPVSRTTRDGSVEARPQPGLGASRLCHRLYQEVDAFAWVPVAEEPDDNGAVLWRGSAKRGGIDGVRQLTHSGGCDLRISGANRPDAGLAQREHRG